MAVRLHRLPLIGRPLEVQRQAIVGHFQSMHFLLVLRRQLPQRRNLGAAWSASNLDSPTNTHTHLCILGTKLLQPVGLNGHRTLEDGVFLARLHQL